MAHDPRPEPASDLSIVDARGMRCPWPVLRTVRALRSADAVQVLADDPIAGSELEALAHARGWGFKVSSESQFILWKQ